MPRRRKTAGTAPGYRHVELGFISEWGEGGFWEILGGWWNCGFAGGLRAEQRGRWCGCTLTDCLASYNPQSRPFVSAGSKNQMMLHKRGAVAVTKTKKLEKNYKDVRKTLC